MPKFSSRRETRGGGIRVAAIDAGSNAIRLMIGEDDGERGFRVIRNERVALRLGRHVFTSRQFDESTLDQAVDEFRRFKSMMNAANVQRYRAVATSATREARNREALIERIYRQSGIRLEVIDGYEEARLIREAVLATLPPALSPQAIIDLGGGSMQVSILRQAAGKVEVLESTSLSLGTVRLMEKFAIADALSPSQIRCIQERVQTQLSRFLPLDAPPAGRRTVLCGGNAEALGKLFPGGRWQGIESLSFTALHRRLTRLTGLSVAQRMQVFGVRKDRADVMAVAAVILGSLARHWGLKQALVPGVGLKEGVLLDVLRSVHADARGARTAPARIGPVAALTRPAAALSREDELLGETRKFATRLGYDRPHCEHVAELAASMFDQLQKLHGMNGQMRLVLRMGALLHDIGHAVGRTAHHRIGEYLVRHAELPGISAFERNMVACLVRYHSEAGPGAEHKTFALLESREQRRLHLLVGLLRVADRLDNEHARLVTGIRLWTTPTRIVLHLNMRRGSDLTLWSVARSAALLEEQLQRRLEIRGKGLTNRLASLPTPPAEPRAVKRKFKLKLKKKK